MEMCYAQTDGQTHTTQIILRIMKVGIIRLQFVYNYPSPYFLTMANSILPSVSLQPEFDSESQHNEDIVN